MASPTKDEKPRFIAGFFGSIDRQKITQFLVRVKQFLCLTLTEELVVAVIFPPIHPADEVVSNPFFGSVVSRDRWQSPPGFYSCASCCGAISQGKTVFAVLAKVGLKCHHRAWSSMVRLGRKKVQALWAAPNSYTKRRGFDLAIVACSKQCSEILRIAVLDELSAYGRIAVEL